MLGEIKSFASVLRVVNMSTRGCRDCPVPDCGAKYLVRLANHLANVHMLDIDQRRKYLQEAKHHPIVKRVAYKSAATNEINDSLLQQQDRVCVVSKVRQHVLKHAQVSSWQEPYTNSEEPGEKRASQSEDLPPAKKPRVVGSTASLATKPCPEFNFRHKFSLLVVGPTQSGKTYFVQQILKHNRIVYEEQKSIRIFWYYNQWQECYGELKTSFGKSIRFERGVPELSEDLCEINARYNNIIILDDLMAEATDSPVVSRLFTQGRHRNASVILLLQNMFPKGKYNTDISRNAQYLALFRSPSDRKQIGIIGERMFDKNRVHFMNAYYKETEKPFGYLLVDNKPGTPPDKQILADLFGECYAYHFGVNSTEPTRVETKPVGKHSIATKITSSRKKPVQTVTWSDVPNDVWQKYTLGASAVRKIPEGYAIIEMYTTSRNERHKPVRGGVLINDENYWPVKLKHRCTGHIKWVNLHSDDPTVQSIVKETTAMENAARPNR